MKQIFCKDLEDAVVFYHECHRDKDVKLVKFVTNPTGTTLVLVRFVDETGKKMSSLDGYIFDYLRYEWTISDLLYAERDNEKKLVEDYMSEVLKTMEELRLCCGVKPVIVIENFRDTKYKMRRIQCPKCGMRTEAKRFYADAVREWNHPETFHLN